jgi:hypothetical protein
MSNEPDPTKDPKFKQVVDHFLKTPPKPHKRKKDAETAEADRAASAVPSDQDRKNGSKSE